MPMTIANVEMAKAWDGEEGEHWTEFADRYDAAGARYWTRFLDAGLIAGGDVVLDIGCGTGESTIDAARRSGSGRALGADLSARMLKLAGERARAAHVANAEFVQADAQVHSFGANAFDVAISRFGAMFFADPVAAFQNIAESLKPGGRVALLSWQGLAENEWLTAIRARWPPAARCPSHRMVGPDPSVWLTGTVSGIGSPPAASSIRSSRRGTSPCASAPTRGTHGPLSSTSAWSRGSATISMKRRQQPLTIGSAASWPFTPGQTVCSSTERHG